MSYTRGEEHAVGVGVESVRGTFVAAQDYVRTREPASIQTVTEKVDIQETKATGMASQGQIISMQKCEGDATYNLRFKTIGYFLKSLFGGLSSTTEAGETIVYRHTYTLDSNILQPTLSLSMARGSFPHKEINGAVVSSLGLTFPVDDVINGTMTIKGRSETTAADFTPAYGTQDYLAPHQSFSFKIATDVAGLDAAPAVEVTSLDINFDREVREKMAVSSNTPTELFAKLLSIKGSFQMDKFDDTYKDLAEANTVRAMRISVINTDEALGVASNPELTITLPNVTFITSEERPLDDTVTETVEFTAHYDDTEANGVTLSLVNEQANYNAA